MLEGWSLARLDELGNGQRPVLKAGPFGSSITKATYVQNGYKVYGQQEVVSGDAFSGSYYIDQKLFEQLSTCDVEPGDVLITMMGTVGRVLLVPEGAERGIINPRLMRLTLDSRKVDPEYACYFLSSSPMQRLMERRAHGGTMPGLNAEAIASIRLPIPPLPEQRKIAEILRTWDEAIDACERLRKTKIDLATWFRTDLFTGRVRVGGFSEPWAKLPLGAVLNEHCFHSAGSEEVFSVSVHKGLINQIEHLGRSFAAKDTAHYNRVLPGDIVYTKSPTGDFPLGIIKQSKVERDVIVSPLYGVFTPATRELGIILDAYFRSPVTVKNYLSPLVQKGAKNTIAITNSRFLEGQLLLPTDHKEHSAIAEIVEDADAEIAVLDRQIETLQAQKCGLMQKLLTGEWRVDVEEHIA